MAEIDIGFVTTSGMEWREAIDVAADLDLDFVELWMDGPTAHTKLADQTDDIAATAVDAGVELLCHLPFPLDIGSPYDPVRTASIDVLKESIRIAAAAGAQKGVVHPRSVAYSGAWTDDEIRDAVYKSIREVHRYGTEVDLEVCPENLFESRFTIHSMPALLSETPAKMTLDTGHARVAGMSDDELLGFVDEYASQISHIHLNETRHDADEHLPLGMGTMPFAQLLTQLRGVDWDGTVSMEVMTGDTDYLEMSKQKLDALR
ncbi:MAG: sugar phosphate isomerase/epimerase family protein [Halobacteriales archaeon]|nr:sugar phosphate isomerase/epimerase family protein [Halobacteriales archaeon]